LETNVSSLIFISTSYFISAVETITEAESYPLTGLMGDFAGTGSLGTVAVAVVVV
jgi:hypothetical protein